MKKTSAFVIVGVIVTLLAGILNGQTPVEIRAAATSAVAGWQQMIAPRGETIWVAPEVQLLYKAKRVEKRDEHDFELASPHIRGTRRAWLREAIALAHPGHPWLARLG